MADKKISLTADEKELFLANVRFGQDGDEHTAVIINQLEREQYENLNRILGLMHAKWSGRKKRHVFKAGYNPFEMNAQFEAEGFITVAKDGFFSTPAELVKRLIELAEFGDITPDVTIAEPSAGTGAIALGICETLGILRSQISVIEQNDIRRKSLEEAGFTVIGKDFMDLPLDQRFDYVLMNPPFENDLDAIHVAKAMKHLKPNGKLAAIMGWNIGISNEKRYGRLRALASLVEENPEEAFKASGTTVQTFALAFTRPPEMSNEDMDAIEPVEVAEPEVEAKEEVVYEKPDVLLRSIISEMAEMMTCVRELAGMLNANMPAEVDACAGLEIITEKLAPQSSVPQPANGKPVQIEMALADERAAPKRKAKQRTATSIAGIQPTLF